MSNNGNAWLIVCDKANWEIAEEKGIFGINNTPGKLRDIKVGDPYVLYLSKIGFVGWGTITQSYFVSEFRLWEDKLYKHRFGISKLKQSSQNALPGAAIKDDLSFITEKNRWSVHFKSGLQRISLADLEIIKDALSKTQTAISSIRTTKEIGDELHDRVVRLFEDSGFSILHSNKSMEGPDIIVEDPTTGAKGKIIIQCKNTDRKPAEAYPSLGNLLDEYANKKVRFEAAAAVIVLSGYKVARGVDLNEYLEKFNVAVWTDDVVEYYEDLAKKISGFSRYQILGDLGIHAQFDEEYIADAIQIHQSKYKYYIASVSPDWLLKTTTVLRRVNYSGVINGYQRLLDKKRITKDIPSYLSSGKWIFPNAIICTTKLQGGLEDAFKDGKLRLASRYGSWWVIDGQHRLYSFAHSGVRNDPNAQLILTLIDSSSFGDDAEAEQAGIFVNLNQQAKKVQKKLLIELENILGLKNPNVQIVFGLTKKAVFKDSISGYSEKSGQISLVAFAEDQSLKEYVSACKLRFGDDKDKIIEHGIKELNDYFVIVSEVFKEEWNDAEYILKTDRGVKALIALLLKIRDRKPETTSLPDWQRQVLSALRISGMPLRNEHWVGEYLGGGGGKKFANDMAIYISKEIIDFEPSVKEETLDQFLSPVGDSTGSDKLQEWMPRLEGSIRVQQMHIDRSTFSYLRFLRQERVKEVRVIFGDIPKDEKEHVLSEIERMRNDGYKIVLTRAQKPLTDGGLFHLRWIGNDNYCIYTDADIKHGALRNSGISLRFVKWNQSPQIKQFDDFWAFASNNPRGVRLDYDWNG